jgi:outer membrane receptor protein involved in Fe transport
VPLAITALGNEQLDELQVSELQRRGQVPALGHDPVGGPGFSQIYFRGVASGENANHSTSLPTVGTYLDEMPITTIQGALDIHAYDLARVEALAGPQGTLYGASSMAGTLKLITNPPDMSGFYGAVDFEANSVAHGDFGGTGEGFVNVPISDHAAVRMVAWYRRDAGYIDNVHGSRTFAVSGITQDNAALVEEDYNDVETYGARVALGIDLNDSWTLRPTVMGQVTNANGNFAQERSSAVTDELQVVQYNPEFSEDEWIQAGADDRGPARQLGPRSPHAAILWRDGRGRVRTTPDYSYFYDALYSFGSSNYDNQGNLDQPETSTSRWRTAIRRILRLKVRISSPPKPRAVIAGLFAQRQDALHHPALHHRQHADSISVPGTDDNIWLTRRSAPIATMPRSAN